MAARDIGPRAQLRISMLVTIPFDRRCILSGQAIKGRYRCTQSVHLMTTWVFLLLGLVSLSSAMPTDITAEGRSALEHSPETHEQHVAEMMQSMYFYASSEAVILFEGWTTKALPGFVASCLLVAAVSALYEGFKCMRQYLANQSASENPERQPIISTTGSPNSKTDLKPKWYNQMMRGGHLVQSVLHVIQLAVGYCLMLVVMTFNIWLTLAVVLGGGLGYLIFAWTLSPPIGSSL